MAWGKSAPDSHSNHDGVDLEKGLPGTRISDESGRRSAASGGSDAGSARPAAESKAAAHKAKRDRYKSMTTTALEAARQRAQAERDAAAQGFDAAERAEREYLARKRAKAAHRDWAETREQWREGAALLSAAFAGFWRAVGNLRHLLAFRAQERRQSAQIRDAQAADVEKRKIEEKLRRELAEDDDDDPPSSAARGHDEEDGTDDDEDDDDEIPEVPEFPQVHKVHIVPKLQRPPEVHKVNIIHKSHNLPDVPESVASDDGSAVLPAEKK